MEEKIKIIRDLSIEEREEVFVDIARILKGTAQVHGDRHFAALKANMAKAIRIDANEPARDDPQKAERVLQQATTMISRFNSAHIE